MNGIRFLPLIRSLWIRSLWIAAPLAIGLLYWISTIRHDGSPSCNSDSAKSALSDALAEQSFGAAAVAGIETQSSSGASLLQCVAQLKIGEGQSVDITYEIRPDQPLKARITSDLGKVKTAGLGESRAETDKRPAEASSEDDERDCAQAEDSGRRISACGRVIERNPSSARSLADAHMHRGDSYLGISAFWEAVTDYEAVLRFDPKNVEALIKRGTALAAAGEQAKALESYLNAIRLDPMNAAAYDARGCSYVAAGILGKAEEDFKRANRLGDKNPAEECHEALAELQLQNERAARKNQKLRERNGDYDAEQQAPNR